MVDVVLELQDEECKDGCDQLGHEDQDDPLDGEEGEEGGGGDWQGRGGARRVDKAAWVPIRLPVEHPGKLEILVNLFTNFVHLHGLQSIISSVNWGLRPNCFLVAMYLSVENQICVEEDINESLTDLSSFSSQPSLDASSR